MAVAASHMGSTVLTSFSLQLQVQLLMQVVIAVQAHLEMQVGLAEQAQLEVELQGQERQAAPSAG